ncbi:MAG: O-antigen polymerase [Erysipelotrichaceae bacterium]|nr:O-antigen polymerase [Erysipelotrichaceae bacterium]
MGIFSERKIVDYVICGLLGLVAVNFLHYGQFILPLICLILFIDNKFRFNFGDIRIFILLCLFGISFFAFSYKLGFYAVMGFCLPMGYYIGVNIKDPSQDNIKKVLYIIALGMCIHVILNGIYDMYMHINKVNFLSSNHYDFWTRDRMSSTATALNLDILIGMLYYIIRYEKNKVLKYSSIIGFAIAIAYCIFAGRRTPLLLIAICLFVSFVYEGFIKNILTEKQKKLFIGLFIAGVLVVLGVAVSYETDFLGCQAFFNKFYIIYKFRQGLLDNSRINAYISAVKLMPSHPWGCQEISGITGIQVHDLWVDIYDYAGVVSWGLMLVYTTYYFFMFIKVMKLKNVDDSIKVMLLTVFVCIVLQMFLEPVMTGSSIFAIICVIIGAIEERMITHEQ